MGALAQKVLQDRAVRNAARRNFDASLAQIRQDLEARSIGGRIADLAGEEARKTFDTAMEVADENREVVAGTIAVLTIWLIRHPLMAWVDKLLGNGAGNDEGDSDNRN